MKRVKILWIILVSGSRLLIAQPVNFQMSDHDRIFYGSKIDSFAWYIKNGKAETSRYPCRLQSHLQYFTGPERTSFSENALHVSGKRKEEFIRMYAMSGLADSCNAQKNFTIACIFYLQALEIAVKNNFQFEELHFYRPGLNNNYFLAGDYNNAMKISSDGLARALDINDSDRISHFENVIGYIHMKQGNYREAAQYFQADLGLLRAMKDTFMEAHALNNLADLAIAEKQYPRAITLLKQSGSLYESIRDTSFFTPIERKGFTSYKLAVAYRDAADFRHALVYALEATALADKRMYRFNSYDLASFYITAGDIYINLQNPDSAIYYLRKGLTLATLISHQEFKRDASLKLALAFATKKIFDSAYFYQAKFSLLNDSITDETSQREILQREADLRIEQQKKIQSVAIEKQKQWRNVIIGLALFSMMALVFFYNRHRLRQKNRYQEQLNRQQNELFNAIADAQDQERKRIAEDIHDSLGSVLSAAKLKLSALKEEQKQMTAAQAEDWQISLRLLDEASAELRNISHNIMPATLSKLGLVAALRNLIVHIASHSGMQISFSAHDFTERIDQKSEMSIYRIVLELINNIVKHAEAEKVTVQLIRYPDYINLTVEDNGRGFDYTNELQEQKGIGLGNILSRVEYLKGTLNVDSEPGRGTAVIIDIPYNNT